MTLTGIPLILLAAAVTGVTGAVTARFWARGGRWRLLTRTVGVLLVEALLVVTVALVVNRDERLYPSWPALRGDTGTVAVAEPVAAGNASAGSFPWRPPGLSTWKLAEPPTVTLPDDYRRDKDLTFPVVLVFGQAGTPARRMPEAVTVTVAPTARTTVAALLTLPGALRHDLRVTANGWSVEGPLAAAFVAAAPPGLAIVDLPADALPPALTAPLRLPS
ncbi:MAG TPA: hypothetical protein VFG35_08645 [Actinoplanes sp.]|nr:hypothetical protein [Actinoplanes sp.]